MIEVGKEYTLNHPKVYPQITVTVISIKDETATVKGMNGIIEVSVDKLS